MSLAGRRLLITGASGGIGREFAVAARRRGASVLLVGRDAETLHETAFAAGGRSEYVDYVVADLAVPEGRAAVVARATQWRGGIDVLVHNAGLGEFSFTEDQTEAAVDRLFAINVLAPMHLTRALLPHLRSRPAAAILSVGSVFGSLGYPGFASYCATKFALRGFTESLRRELADTNVRVHYLAPRSTRTGFNASAVERMNAELGVAMDTPDLVAATACDMLERGHTEAVIGWPEKLFVRINALLPRVVDGSLRKQLPIIRRHAQEALAERNR